MSFTSTLNVADDVTDFVCDDCGAQGSESISDYERDPFTRVHREQCPGPRPAPAVVHVLADELLAIAEHISEALRLLRENLDKHTLGASGVTMAAEAVVEGDLRDAGNWLTHYAKYSDQFGGSVS